MSRWPERRQHGGPPPTAEHLNDLKAMDESELAAYADALLSKEMPTSGFDALVAAIGSKGQRRDAAVCSVCGGPPNRSEAWTVCRSCLRERSNRREWLIRFRKRKARRLKRLKEG